jgi:hypothetical protein
MSIHYDLLTKPAKTADVALSVKILLELATACLTKNLNDLHCEKIPHGSRRFWLYQPSSQVKPIAG